MAAQPEGWRLVEDCGGLIDEIAIAVPPSLLESRDRFSADALRAFGNLIISLERRMKLFVLFETGSRSAIDGWLDSLLPRCEIIRTEIGNQQMTSTAIWAQDPVHVRYKGSSRRFDRAISENPGRHTDWLGGATGSLVGEFNFHLAGGNQLVGDNFRLVGYRSIELSRRVTPKSQDCDIYHALEAMDPRALHIVGFRTTDMASTEHLSIASQRKGGPHQFGFHLDMFISVTGLRVEGQHLLLAADPVLPNLRSNTAIIASARRQIDATVKRLEQRGFRVLRNPVPYCMSSSGKVLPRLYNNVLVENAIRSGHERPLVWLPCFGDDEAELACFDDLNAATWERLGFFVVRVQGWSCLASRNGALRCASKVLSRTPSLATYSL